MLSSVLNDGLICVYDVDSLCCFWLLCLIDSNIVLVYLLLSVMFCMKCSVMSRIGFRMLVCV